MKNKFKINIGFGDNGYTDIFSKRIPKTDLRIKLNSLLDEINAYIGVLRSKNKKAKELIIIQKDIIFLSSIVAGYIKENELDKKVNVLGKLINNFPEFNVKKFIIFGEDYFSAMLNLIRTKIRICEIVAWELKKNKVARYLNRLSDYIFLLSIKYS